MFNSVTKLIVTLNVLVFVAMVAGGGNPIGFDGETLVRFGANFTPYTVGPQPWRLITYMFEHGSFMHIALNMWCLWNLGALAEQIYGDLKYLMIYFVTGVGAGIASLLLRPVTLSVGASGAIMGIAGALIATLYWRKVPYPDFAVKQYLSSILRFAGLNLVIGFALPGVDNWAHIGGVVTGLACGLVFPLGGRVTRPDDY